MEQVEHRRPPVHQVLTQFQVPQGQRLDHSEPKVRLEQPVQLVLLVQQGQLGQVRAEPALAEQLALEELPVQLEGLGQVLVQRLSQQGRLAERMW